MKRTAKGPAPNPARSFRQLGTVLLIALPLVLVALLLRPRVDTPGRFSPEPTIDRRMLDSLAAADARGDRLSTLVWAERLGAKYPRDHDVLLARGTAWSDFAVEQRARRVLPRPTLRTSLERMECTVRAVTLIDSSIRIAHAQSKWFESMNRLAGIEEALGLPGDALMHYELMKLQRPHEAGPAVRAYRIRAFLYDPVHPDTSEWDRRMRELGKR